jgi:peroxiredoxin
MVLQPGQPAPSVTFARSDGADVALSDLYRDRTVVLAFLRHFG